MTDPALVTPDWLSEFTIPANSSGAVLALDFTDDGIWAARLHPDGSVATVVSEPRITPRILDIRIASYLRDSEAVAGVESDAGFAELIDLCPQARAKLYDRDSALLMGVEHLRLVTVSLDTVMSATVPEVNRVQGMIGELAQRDPVAAIFLGPGTDDWPGLWEALSDRGYALLLPEDEFPETFAGSDASTGLLESVSAPVSLAWAAENDDQASTVADEPARSDQPGAESPTRLTTKTVLTAAAIVLVGIGGIGVALVTVNEDSVTEPSVTAAAGDPSGSAESAATSTGVPVAGSDEVRAARAQMKRYRPPPTTTTSTTTSRPAEASTGAGPRPRPRPPRRTIPNPIPGLPPIIIGLP